MHLNSLTVFLPFLPLILANQPLCNPSTFTSLSLPGTKILNITTTPHTNLTLSVPDEQNHFATNITSLSACEVVIAYTHTDVEEISAPTQPPSNTTQEYPADTVLTTIMLPLSSEWTGRLLGAGGGGWVTGVDDPRTLFWGASRGFAVTSTNSGLTKPIPPTWALTSSGQSNMRLVHNFASWCLQEAGTLGKAVAKSYYSRDVSKSYWNGCSQGGRQGHIVAQRFAGLYDGVLGTAAGMHWGRLTMQFMWAQAVMNEAGEYPSPCELEGIHIAAVKKCDAGEGIVLDSTCEFDASGLVGKTVECPSINSSAVVTEMAAKVAKATWQGSRTPEGEFLWYGLDISARIVYHASTLCGANGTCVGDPNAITVEWQKYFLAKDPDFDVKTVNTTTFAELFKESIKWDPLIAATDPDLSAFAKAGGKMITWHGTSDVLLGPKSTESYTKSVHDLDPKASDYYRYFEAPGLDHCGFGTRGYYPGDALDSLIAWVENGTKPDTLKALNRETGKQADLCLWPKKMVYVGGESSVACK